jgi:hypothetical protein
MIETAANGLRQLRNNTMFRSIVHEQVALQFDGDDNVLLTTLDSVCTINGINLDSAMTSELNSIGRADLVQFVNGAIHGFQYFGDTIYLQLYVPNFSGVTLSQTPIIAENHADEGSVAIRSYEIDNSLSFIDSISASSTLTWIIGGNENVTNSGRLRVTSHVEPGVSDEYTLRMTAIEIHDMKEGFPNGKADIMYAMYRGSGTCINAGYRMVFLSTFKKGRHTLNSSTETWVAPISYPFTPNTTHGDYINMMWWEKDVRKKFEKQKEVVPGCSGTTITYRAKQSIYGIQTIANPWNSSGGYMLPHYEFDNTSSLSGLTPRLKFN